MSGFNNIKGKIQNNRNIIDIKHRIRYRDSFRIRKTKDGDRYRVSKRLKNKSKSVSVSFIKKLCEKPMGIVELLMKLGIYKKTLSLKLLFILIPFIILIFTDSFVISVVITTINIFCCYFMFSITTVSKSRAMENGKFDYGKYKYLKARGETISILLMLLISMFLIIFGHYYLKSLIQLLTGLVVDI